MIDQGLKPVAYPYLEARPHPWRRQPYLRGRTMTVGQLVATMCANGLTPEQAADDLDLPLAYSAEALLYYAEQHDLVDEELREDRRRLEAKATRLSLRLYLDDCAYSKLLLQILQAPPQQHTVAIPEEVGLREAPDPEHFAYARRDCAGHH